MSPRSDSPVKSRIDASHVASYFFNVNYVYTYKSCNSFFILYVYIYTYNSTEGLDCEL